LIILSVQSCGESRQYHGTLDHERVRACFCLFWRRRWDSIEEHNVVGNDSGGSFVNFVVGRSPFVLVASWHVGGVGCATSSSNSGVTVHDEGNVIVESCVDPLAPSDGWLNILWIRSLP
jgi:hypothetical protein